MTRYDLEQEILKHATFYPVTAEQFDRFERMARDIGSASEVIEKWKKFRASDRMHKYIDDFFDMCFQDEDIQEPVNIPVEKPVEKKPEKKQGGLFGAGPWDNDRSLRAKRGAL